MNHHQTDDALAEARYEIRLAGTLDARWAEQFDGLTLTREPAGISVLRGAIPDQPALHGVLQRIRDLGLPLVAVTRIDESP